MILLDTHAWVWWVNGSAELSATARNTIEDESAVAVSAVSCWEIAVLVTKGRLDLNIPVRQWIERSLVAPGMVSIPLSPTAALLAGSGELLLHADPADRMLAATAIWR